MNADLAEYHVPVNADVPDIDITFVPENDPYINPLGVKGIGEIGITGVVAAIANAVYHATGKRVRDLPVRLDKVIYHYERTGRDCRRLGAVCAGGREAVLATVVQRQRLDLPAARRADAADDRGAAGRLGQRRLPGRRHPQESLVAHEGRRRPGDLRLDRRETTSSGASAWAATASCRCCWSVSRPTRPARWTCCGTASRQRQPGVIATVIGGDGAAATIGERLLLLPDGTVQSTLLNAALGCRLCLKDVRLALRYGQVAGTRPTRCRRRHGVDVFLEAVLPPLPLVIFGTGPRCRAAGAARQRMGWHVTVVDTRRDAARPERFPLRRCRSCLSA